MIRRLQWPAILIAALAISSAGCQTAPVISVEAGRVKALADVARSEAPMASGRPGPRVALVLGGGGIRGFAHVGVLQALEKGDIRPDIVVGTSAGAVVGAAYASGLSAEEIDRAASKLELSSLLDWTLDRRGFIRGNALAKWVSSVVRVSSIEDMPIPFAAVATALPNGTA